MSEVTFHSEADLDAIDRIEWDSLLLPGDHLASWRFLRVCRNAGIEDARYRYVAIRQRGRLVATAVLTSMTVSLELLAPRGVRAFARGGRAILPRFLRVRTLFCGLPVSFGTSCLRFASSTDGDTEEARIFPLVARAMEEFAEEEGAGLLCAKEFTDAERGRADALEQFGFFRAPSLPGLSLGIDWPSFDSYLNAMRAGYRRQVRASLAFRSERELSLRIAEDWGAECPPLHELYGQVMDRAEFQLERLPVAFFERLNAEFGSDARALLLERDGTLEAAAILLYGPNTLTFLLAGIDYARNETDRAYQNLVVEVVAEAIRCGASRLELGQTSYALKTRLGGVADPRWLFLKHRRRPVHETLRRCAGLLFPTASVPERRVFGTRAP